MVEIELKNVSNFILKNLTTKFSSGKLSIIIGPNGAGKTTLLKAIVGLVEYSGSISFDGKGIDDVPPYDRGVSYVPQNNALFTHMTVRDNIAFGLKVRKASKGSIDAKVKELTDIFHLSNIIDEYPQRLSGGEARKVALARALAINPKALLLDEPFTNLDTETKHIVEQEIMMTVKGLKRTVILVIHSLEKGIMNADRLSILWNGRLVFDDSPLRLDENTLPPEARWWFGAVIDVDEYGLDEGICYVRISGAKVPCLHSKNSLVKKVYIPPNAIKIRKLGSLKGMVKEVFNDGSYFRAVIDIGGMNVYTTIPPMFKKGDPVSLEVERVIPIGEQ